MSEIVIPDELVAELERAGGPVTLRATSGRKVGDFNPEPPVPWNPAITRDELDRRARESRGRTLSEVLKKLDIE